MKSRRLGLVALYLFIFLVTGCTKQEKQEVSYPVTIGVAIEEDVPHFIRGVGQFSASVQVFIKAQVSGYLTNVLFVDGQQVEEGELLMTIDPRIYEANVKEAEGQLAEDQAKLTFALELAETYGELVGNDYISRIDYEQAVQDVDALKGKIALDMAALKRAEVELGYTQLRAPTKGYLGLRKYDPGNYVDAFADTNLVTLNKTTPISIQFVLPSQYLYEIREAQKKEPLYLEVEIPSDPSHPLPGSLWFIDNNVNQETGMFTLEGTIPNEEERAWPGLFGRVYLRLKTLRDAILIPKQAVVVGETGNYVFVLDEETMTVKMRMIGKGFVYKDYLVALWGIQAGEKLITDGQLNLHNGAKVHIPNESESE